MSIKIMAEVWEYSQHSGSALLCLLAIADHANDDGVAYPGSARLASRVRVNRRHVFKLLDRLMESGELIAFNRAADEGGFTSNAYAVVSGCSENEIRRRTSKMKQDVRGIITWGGSVLENTTPTVPEDTTLVSQGTHEPPVEPPVEPTTSEGSGEVPKSPRPRDPLFDVIAEYSFGVKDTTLLNGSGGRVGKVLKEVRKVDPGVNSGRLLAFYEWYRAEYPEVSYPQDAAKFAVHYAAFLSNPLKHARKAASVRGDTRRVEHIE